MVHMFKTRSMISILGSITCNNELSDEAQAGKYQSSKSSLMYVASRKGAVVEMTEKRLRGYTSR